MSKDNDQEIRNPELVMAMRSVNNNNTAAARARMAGALMEATLLAPVRQETVLVEKKGPANRIKFEDITNTTGDSFYLAFTDMDEYNKWNEDGTHDHAVAMTMNDFGNLLLRNVNDLKGFVINPYGENISISKKLLLSLLRQWETMRNQADEN